MIDVNVECLCVYQSTLNDMVGVYDEELHIRWIFILAIRRSVSRYVTTILLLNYINLYKARTNEDTLVSE